MNKEVISGKQVAFLLFMFLNSGILLIGQKSVAGADSWIALILAALCIVPFYYVHINLLCRYPGKNYFAILESVYGSFLGRLLAVFYIIYAVFLASAVTNTQVNFVRTVTLLDIPRLPFMALMLVACFVILKSGVELLGRWAEMIVPVTLLIIAIATPVDHHRDQAGPYVQPLL